MCSSQSDRLLQLRRNGYEECHLNTSAIISLSFQSDLQYLTLPSFRRFIVYSYVV
jgi:hypothetical protein